MHISYNRKKIKEYIFYSISYIDGQYLYLFLVKKTFFPGFTH